jgi:hypothetical protein
VTLIPIPERTHTRPPEPPRPRGLTVALVLCYVLGALCIVGGLWSLKAILQYDDANPTHRAGVLWLFIAGPLYLSAARGLRKGTRAGRWMAMVTASLVLFSQMAQHSAGFLTVVANLAVLVLVFKNRPRREKTGEGWYRRRAAWATALGACAVILAGIITAEIAAGRGQAAAPRAPVPSAHPPTRPTAALAPAPPPLPPTPLPLPGARVWTNQPTPNALKQMIESLPHRVREGRMSSVFVGTWVHWAGVVKSVERATDYYHVGTSSIVGKGLLYTVLEFSLDQGPAVEPLRRGDSVFYSGRLREPIREPLSRDLIAFIVDSATLLRTVPGSNPSVPPPRAN